MAFFNGTYCQFCETLITKEQWNKYPYSSKRLHREVNDFWSQYFPRRKLEGKILEKVLWPMIFGCVDALAVYGFLKTYFLMVINLNDYVKDDDDHDDF